MFYIRSLILVSTLLPHGFCCNDSIQWNKENGLGVGVGMVEEIFLQASTVLLDGKALCGWLCNNGQCESDDRVFPRVVGIIAPSCATFPARAQEAEVSAHPKKPRSERRGNLEREWRGRGFLRPLAEMGLPGMDEASS